MTENLSHAILDACAKICFDASLPASIGINGSIRKSKDSEKIENVSYPKKIPIREASWAGNEAKWEFARGEIEGWENIYWLNIYFGVPRDVSRTNSQLASQSM